MKFNHPVYMKFFTKEPLDNKENFIERLEFRCNEGLTPDTFGINKPNDELFSFENIKNFDDLSSHVWFEKKNKYFSYLLSLTYRSEHSVEFYQFELDKIDHEKMLSYFKKVSIRYDADFAVIDMNKFQKQHRNLGWVDVTPSSYILKKYLPNIYWGMIFGKVYVELFGLHNLMAIQAYKVEVLSNGSVFIQLTPNVSDVYQKIDEVDSLRELIQESLNPYAFMSEDKEYCEGNSLLFLNGLSENQAVWVISKIGEIGVFLVPNFKFNTKTSVPDQLLEPTQINNQLWSFSLASNWLLRKFQTPIEDGSGYNIYIDQFIFFLKPDGYDAPVEKELFFTAADRDDESLTNYDYVTNFIDNLNSQYSDDPETTISSSITINESYVIGKFDIITNQEFCKSLIFTRIFVFENFYVKVTFMDYWCDDLDASKVLANQVFDSFNSLA